MTLPSGAPPRTVCRARRCRLLPRARAGCSPTSKSTRLSRRIRSGPSLMSGATRVCRPTRRGPGQPQRGVAVYAEYCAHCHGSEGRGGARASSIVDGSYLALVSDQDLRTNVIVGRPEMGAPDFRDDVPGKPMSDQEVTDVVAWLAAQRPRLPGQPYPGRAPDRT